jgi:hypothetical protein
LNYRVAASAAEPQELKLFRGTGTPLKKLTVHSSCRPGPNKKFSFKGSLRVLPEGAPLTLPEWVVLFSATTQYSDPVRVNRDASRGC